MGGGRLKVVEDDDGGRAAERTVAADLARALDVDESGRHVLDA